VLRSTLRRGFEQTLEWIIIVLMLALAVVVTAGVVFRYTGNALVWYDEVASILLAWVTYYGASLAALKRANLGVPEIVRMLSPPTRVLVTLVAEGFVFVFFITLAWVGYTVLEVLAGDTLVSLPGVSVAWAQSVIPVSSVLFIIAEALALPQILHEARQP
jgi:TRAP-type C4-dicarboxylate transport system permease small subunit